MTRLIKSHSGFQKLRTILVGDVYPPSFAQAIPKRYHEIFLQLHDITKHDLDNFVKILQSLDIEVFRPDFQNLDLYLDEHDNLLKPPITPRDWAMTLGDTLYITPQYLDSFTSIENTIDEFVGHGQKVLVLDRSIDLMPWITFPSVVRVGRDLFVDIMDQTIVEKVMPVLNEFSKIYRVHLSRTGDHSDGVFCPILPGHIMSTHYRTQYEHTFPDWQVYWLQDTTKNRSSNGVNGKWWLPGFDYAHFNDQIFDFASTWIGDSRETVYEVNMLVVDEKNILVIAENDSACRHLESLGFKVHVVEFRSRGFWDGGLHCLTTDLYREGALEDYWPKRGDPGIYNE